MPENSNPPSKITQVASFDYPWKAAESIAGSIILVSDDQFRNLARFPHEAVEKPAPWFDQPISLHDFCSDLARSGAVKIHIAFDYFFGGSGRTLFPDSAEFIENLKLIHDVALVHGLGIEPSVLSPLELGAGYQAETGEQGRWMQYGEGYRDPLTGCYSLTLWKHSQWVNNKGPTQVEWAGVRAFAFREKPVDGTVYFSVHRDDIIELPTPEVEDFPGTSPVHYGAPAVGGDPSRQFQAHLARIHGSGMLGSVDHPEEFDRVLVIMLYRTMEMDYFSPSASDFVTRLANRYHDAGIHLDGVYSDEMHIQQDWIYHHHFDQGQFTVRYVSEGFEKRFAQEFGDCYADFAPWLVYFTSNQHGFLATHEPKLPSQHVLGPGREDIARTHLFRRNYYHFLEKSVIDLMISARKHIESLQGTELEAFYHSTWAESPTCDAWAVDGVQRDWSPAEHRKKYEYTPEFLWSNTVQQASSACANYFAWNDFLTGGNNDIPEGGFSDRDYYGRAIAASLAVLNRNPLASCGMWGMPDVLRQRMTAISEAYGVGGHPVFRAVQSYAPRQVEVLFIYPQDLVAVDERFGSWMVQYGYANFITAEKLLQYGSVSEDGWLDVKGPAITSRYRVVCVLFEPFVSTQLLDLFETFISNGGSLVWSGPPPLLNTDGTPADASRLGNIFGLDFSRLLSSPGFAMPGRSIQFSEALESVAPMNILTDLLVDRVYPLHTQGEGLPVAVLSPGGSSQQWVVGVLRRTQSGGSALYLGFRPRDDQSASLGAESRTWFELLNALGVYASSQGLGVHANPSVLSRTSPYLVTAFPNGAVSVAPHFRSHEENWQGGFFRDEEQDTIALAENPLLDDDTIQLVDLQVMGQTVSYNGRHCLAWIKGDQLEALSAFAGFGCTHIELNDEVFRWSGEPVDLAWHPLGPQFQVDGSNLLPLYRIWVSGEGPVTIPLGLKPGQDIQVWLGTHVPLSWTRRRGVQELRLKLGYCSELVPFTIEGSNLVLDLDEAHQEHWLYITERI